MTYDDVMALLEAQQNPKGIANWHAMPDTHGLSSFGLGLTQQRKLAKKIGKNRALAETLWQSDNYDAKVIGLLIDDPKAITVAQAEAQVEALNGGMLCHVFSSCDATLAKSPVAFEVAQNWLKSGDEIRRRCAYGLVYELSKKKAKVYTDEFFMGVISQIDAQFEQSSKKERLAMGTALMGIGKRNVALNQAALVLAERIGPIDFNEHGQKCDPFDVAKHLTSDYLKEKLGIG